MRERADDVAQAMAELDRAWFLPPAQARMLDILQFKLDILWTMLDAIEKACQ